MWASSSSLRFSSYWTCALISSPAFVSIASSCEANLSLSIFCYFSLFSTWVNSCLLSLEFFLASSSSSYLVLFSNWALISCFSAAIESSNSCYCSLRASSSDLDASYSSWCLSFRSFSTSIFNNSICLSLLFFLWCLLDFLTFLLFCATA
jgi:hypothetical protein